MFCKAVFPLLLACLGNNSSLGEKGTKSSFAFWSEGRQFNWKCKLRSHVSPQWIEPWVKWMCTRPSVRAFNKREGRVGSSVFLEPRVEPSHNHYHWSVVITPQSLFHKLGYSCCLLLNQLMLPIFRKERVNIDLMTARPSVGVRLSFSFFFCPICFHLPHSLFLMAVSLCCWLRVCREYPVIIITLQPHLPL